MFNKETEYALRGLVYIQVRNYKSIRPGIAEIAKEIGTPPFFIAKIMQRMVKQGFLESIKGKGGGFYFNTAKPQVFIKDVVFFVEGNKSFTGCGFGFKECNGDNPCPLHFQYAPIRDAIDKLLSEESVQSLAQKLSENPETHFNWLG